MYNEYFNIMNSSTKTDSMFLNIIFYLLILAIVFFKLKKNGSRLIKFIPWIGGIGLIIIISVSIYSDKDIRSYQQIVVKKEHTIVEGPIEVADDLTNSIVVNDKRFYFIDKKSNKKKIELNSEARVFVYKDTILGLWIKE